MSFLGLSFLCFDCRYVFIENVLSLIGLKIVGCDLFSVFFFILRFIVGLLINKCIGSVLCIERGCSIVSDFCSWDLLYLINEVEWRFLC